MPEILMYYHNLIGQIFWTILTQSVNEPMEKDFRVTQNHPSQYKLYMSQVGESVIVYCSFALSLYCFAYWPTS